MPSTLVSNTVADLRSSQCFRSLSDVLLRATKDLGFEYYAIAQGNSSKTDIGDLVVIDCPQAFMEYQAQTLDYYNSPVQLAARVRCDPFLWSELDKLIKMNRANRDYLKRAASFGLVEGFTIPVHMPGEPSGFVTFVKGDAESVSEEHLAKAHYIGTHAFAAARRVRDLVAERKTEGPVGRDREIIRMLARGRSKFAIARSLDLTEDHVSETLQHWRRYYGVGSRTELVVQALYDRSIAFEDVVG